MQPLIITLLSVAAGVTAAPLVITIPGELVGTRLAPFGFTVDVAPSSLLSYVTDAVRKAWCGGIRS
jgi:hypothetical protein